MAAQGSAVRREVVACLVSDGAQHCLVRRSQRVRHDRGLWHCVTGYCEPGVSPRDTALSELQEELALDVAVLAELRTGLPLRYTRDGVSWVVHTFLALTSQRRFLLNWENDAYLWTDDPEGLPGCVWWLRDVHESIYVGPTEPAAVHHTGGAGSARRQVGTVRR